MGDENLVPGVFGWHVDKDNYVYIYMELLKGRTLHERREVLDGLI